MNKRMRAMAARIGRPMLGPVRSQMFAWIDYRIRTGGDPSDQLKRAWSRDATAGPMPVSFAEVVPALLNAISTSNTAAREGKRKEIEMTARLVSLEAEVRAMRSEIARLSRDAGMGAA